jgi:hypothetical protein
VVVLVVVVVVVIGSVGTVTVVGRVPVGTVVVMQPTTGRQTSCGAAGTALENVPAANSPAPRRPNPATARGMRRRVMRCRRERNRFMLEAVVNQVVDHGQQKRESRHKIPPYG